MADAVFDGKILQNAEKVLRCILFFCAATLILQQLAFTAYLLKLILL
jgi:hypothetical protein